MWLYLNNGSIPKDTAFCSNCERDFGTSVGQFGSENVDVGFLWLIPSGSFGSLVVKNEDYRRARWIGSDETEFGKGGHVWLELNEWVHCFAPDLSGAFFVSRKLPARPVVLRSL